MKDQHGLYRLKRKNFLRDAQKIYSLNWDNSQMKKGKQDMQFAVRLKQSAS